MTLRTGLENAQKPIAHTNPNSHAAAAQNGRPCQANGTAAIAPSASIRTNIDQRIIATLTPIAAFYLPEVAV